MNKKSQERATKIGIGSFILFEIGVVQAAFMIVFASL
jgi:hypothetical protein